MKNVLTITLLIITCTLSTLISYEVEAKCEYRINDCKWDGKNCTEDVLIELIFGCDHPICGQDHKILECNTSAKNESECKRTIQSVTKCTERHRPQEGVNTGDREPVMLPVCGDGIRDTRPPPIGEECDPAIPLNVEVQCGTGKYCNSECKCVLVPVGCDGIKPDKSAFQPGDPCLLSPDGGTGRCGYDGTGKLVCLF